MTECTIKNYINVEITSDEYNKGYVDALKEVVRLICDNHITDILKLEGTLLFAIDKLKKD